MVVILWRKALYRAKSDGDAEIKRVWVEPEYRGQYIASRMIIMLEEKAKEKGFRRICSGVISEELNGPDIIPKPLVVDDYMEIGYILPNSFKPSVFTLSYIDILKKSM